MTAQTDAPLAKLLADATPGPWQVNGTRHSGDLKVGQGARLHFVGPDDDPVTAVFYDMTTGKGLADAYLIALAPTLAAEVIALRAIMARDALAQDASE